MKTKKIFLTCILIIILTFISNNIVIAGDNNSDEYMNKATIKSRGQLSLKTHYTGYESNEGDVGQTIAVKTGDGVDSDNQPGTNMSDEYDHIYCIRHDDSAADSLMLIKQFINVRGDEATAYWLNGAKRITNNTWDYYEGTVVSDKVQTKYNIALSYLFSKKNYRRAYSMDRDNRLRQNAVHMLLNDELKKTWGTKLLYGNFYDYDGYYANAYSFYRESKEYATDNYNSTCIPKVSITSSTTEITPEITGPYQFDFGVENEAAQWIYPIDANGNWIGGHYEGRKWENGRYVSKKWVSDNTISFYKDSKGTEQYESVSEIKSRSYFYIKNTSGRKIKQVQIKASSGYKNIQTDTKQIEYISNLIGPISMDFKGRIQWIWPLDTNGNWLGENEFIVCNDKGQKIKKENITSKTVFYIQNNSNKKIDKIHIKLRENTIMCSEIWWLERMDGQPAQRLITVDTSTEMANSIIIIKAKLKTRDLIINKKDSITGNNISSPAEFKIKTSKGKWLTGISGSYNYENSDVSLATKYRTNDKGVLELKDLLVDTYEIFEVTAPNGYDIQKQNRYDKTNKWINCGKVNLNVENSNVTISIKNDLIISISGHVWEEGISGKGSYKDYDSLYNSNVDRNLGGITVKLIKKGEKTPTGTTITNSDGTYRFDKLIKKIDLKNYYVEFDYSSKNTDNIKYIPVAFNLDKTKGSKALANNLPTNDIVITNTAFNKATTYTGTTNNLIATYGLENIGNYNGSTLTLGDINLGIKPLLDPGYDLRENIAYVKIYMKGYEYTYSYAGTGDTSRVAAPIVRFQDGSSKYTYLQDIYPSDIVYDIKNSTEELKVEVTYRINVTNTANYNLEELYREQKLFITKLTNTYDTNRYELKDENWSGSNGTVTMKENYRKSLFNAGIEPSKSSKPAYITFKVKHDKNNDPKKDPLVKILNNSDGLAEDFPTKATVIGYHQYTRKDYSWSNNITKEQTHNTKNHEEKADAPYLTFRLGKERTLSGKVFKDGVVTKDGQKLGNGKYDDGENVIEKVKVELLDVKENVKDITQLSVSNIYGTEGEEKRTAISKQAQVETEKNGNYSIKGIVPGRYYLRFTYGDGTQKIYTIDGNEIATITAKDYKSTIITNNEAKTALNGGTDYTWYKKLNSSNDSVAIDSLSKRKEVNEGTTTDVMAGTAELDITIENTETNTVDIVITENVQKALESNIFEGLNLGIIEQPRQEAEIEKIITNVKLTNSQGNVLYNGNPENIPSQGTVAISDLDNKKNGGSVYVRAEIIEDSIYGSNLELTYEVRIQNISDVNYYNEEYYKYGEKNSKKEITLKPNDVRDYLDKSLKYDADKSDKIRIEEINENQLETITVNEKDIKAQEFTLKGWNELYTNKNKERDEKTTKDKVTLVANRQLSKEDDDMEITSMAEIKGIEHTPDPADAETSEAEKTEQIKVAPKEVHTNGMAKATLTITPPTGEDRQETIIYAIAGITSLIVLSIVVLIIKKKTEK